MGERVGECVTLQRRGGGRRSRSAITRVGGKISSNERESEAGREGGREGRLDDSLIAKVRAERRRQ